MRSTGFIIFFSIFLLIYGLVNYYIFIRGWQALPRNSVIRYVYLCGFILVALSYIFGRFLERYSICLSSEIAIWIGSFWLAYMLYLFLGILGIDIARGISYVFRFYPSVIFGNYEAARRIAALIVVSAATAVILAGHVNALHPRLHRMDIDISGKGSPGTTLNLIIATDIHLGVLIRNSRLIKLVNTMNSLKADVVLLAGDIVDEDLAPVIEQNIGDTLRNIKSRYGVFAITGNHEYIGGAEAAVAYLSEHGIKMLRDEAVLVNGEFYIAGREDRSITRFTGKKRKPLHEIMKGVDKSLPVILMDHQPFGLNSAAQNGVDLQVSGHTHHGQLWPFNFITRKVYEISRGYKKKGGSHIYVSTGFGTWGPPVRVGNRPEIVNIRLHFK